jgi:hypothetical protein
VDAYDIMHEWDRVVGNPPRTDEELDREVPPLLPSGDYEGWKALLEAKDVPAIMQGMRIWGVPIESLTGFEMDEHIETIERSDLLE